jgi:hypothetical protein
MRAGGKGKAVTVFGATENRAANETGRVWISRLIFWLVIAAGAALSVRVVLRAKFSGADSWSPMTQALDFLHRFPDQRIYETLFFSRHVKFQYPLSSLLTLDFGRLLGVSQIWQYNLANAFVLILTGVLFALFVRKLFGDVSYRGIRVPVAAAAYIVALRFYPDNLAFEIGQMQLALGLLFLAACYAKLNNRPGLAGGLVGLAAMTKPQFLPLALLAIFRRDWRFTISLLAVAIVLTALSVLLYGWYNHLDYLKVLSFLSRRGEYQHLNQSIGGLLDRWLYHGPSLDRDPLGAIPQSAFPPYIPAVYFTVLATSIIFFILPFAVKVKGEDAISELIGFCMAATLFTMASPIAWVHHFNVLLPGYAVAIKAALDRWQGGRRYFSLCLIGLSAVLVGYPVVPASAVTDPARNLLQSHVLFGACILVVVFLQEAFVAPRQSRASA